jgi:uncharacterized protein YjbI with pentapeptide repeats
MKLKTLASAAVLMALGVTAAIYVPRAIRQGQVKELLATKQCQGCNLSGTNLQGLDLTGVNLAGANLAGANLQGASLGNANLQRANLERANLERADLGCTALKFNLRADEDSADVSLNMESSDTAADPNRTLLNFNLNANSDGATIRFNLGGCANLKGANLKGATLPDGSVKL